MRKPVHTFIITEDQMSYIERLHYEVTGLRMLTAQFMSNSPWKPCPVRFREVRAEYIDSFKAFNAAQQSIISAYAPAYTGGRFMCAFNFVTSEVEVYETA